MPDKQKQPFTLCFRVEDDNGTGMYCGDFRPHLDPDTYEDHRPAPYRDGIEGYWNTDYYFGFQTMDAFKRWMGDIFVREWSGQHAKKALTKCGLMISVYLTDDYHMGHSQMCFRKSTAKLVARMPVLTPNMETQSCHSASRKSPSRPRTTKANPSRLSTNLLSWNLPPRSAVSRRLRPQAVGLIPRAN